MAKASGGGIAPNEFVTTLSDLIEAKTKEERAAGSRRSIMARFEKLGAHKPGLNLFLKLRAMDCREAELTLTSALNYCRFAQLGIGDQATLFPASSDAGAPSDRAAAQLAAAGAFEEGFAAGKAGRKSSDHRYAAGSPAAQRFYEGWSDGQELVVLKLGEPRPADGSPLRPKAKAKDGAGGEGAEIRSAAPSGGSRRGGGGMSLAERDRRKAAREQAGTY